MSYKDDLKKLITRYRRRLQILKEKEASYGLETPVSIITEIADVEIKIEELQQELTHPIGSDEEPSVAEDVTVETDEPITTELITIELANYLKHHVNENIHRYPIRINIEQAVREIQKVTNSEYYLTYGYVKGLFDLLKVIGCSEYEENKSIVLENAVNAATVRALCLAIREDVFGVFNYYKSGYITNPMYGSWLLDKIENKREFLDTNHNREPSRIRNYVVVLIKAMLEGEPVLLFQYDEQRIDGSYKFIGGHVDPKDKGNALVAAQREINEEIQVDGESPTNIRPRSLSNGQYEYFRISERIGAYTQYRVWVFDCTLMLPQGSLVQEFFGEKRRLTKWLPLSQLTPQNKEIAQQEVLRWIVANDWFNEAQISTAQSISRIVT